MKYCSSKYQSDFALYLQTAPKVLLIGLIVLHCIPLSGQTNELLTAKDRLTKLKEQYQSETGWDAAILKNIQQATRELLEQPFPSGKEAELLQSEALLLLSLVAQRQGDSPTALRKIEQSMQIIENTYPGYDLSCLPQMNHYAFLLTVYKEEYERPIQLRQAIRQLLKQLTPMQRIAQHETITVNNLIRLADLQDRTEKPAEAVRLLQETEDLIIQYPVTEDSRLQFQIFQLHYFYYHSELWKAERLAREMLFRLQQQTERQYQLAKVQALYGNVLYGLGRLTEAENYYQSALLNYQACGKGAYEERELRRDLAACYEAQSEYIAGRTLLEKQLTTLRKGEENYDLHRADLYGSLADNYFREYAEKKPDRLQQAVAYDRQARRHYYDHRARLVEVRDVQWAAVGEIHRRDRSIAILCAAYRETNEDRYLFEALEVLEQSKNILLRAQMAAFVAEQPAWSEVKIDHQLLSETLKDHQQTLVALVSTRSHLYLLALSSRGKLFLPLEISKENLAHEVMLFQESIQQSPSQPTSAQRQALVEHSRKFYDLSLHPLEAIATPRLLLMNEGPLETLPFSLLLREDVSSNQPLTNWPFAVHRYSFSYTYSLDFYLHPRRSTPSSQTAILAFAPNFEAGYLRGDTTRSAGELHKNADEVSYLTGRFPCTAYVGRDASLDNFLRLAPYFSILHLATHAVANTEQGGKSYLTFSEVEHRPHRLHAHELVTMNIPAELVVLSACETGLGEWQAGEGVVGLERAFWASGAKSLISTYWKVSDRASAQLMQIFYDQLAKGLPKDVALQQAQIQFLTENDAWLAHPFFWAGYGQKGATTPIPLTVKPEYRLWWVAGSLLLFGVMYLWQKKKPKR